MFGHVCLCVVTTPQQNNTKIEKFHLSRGCGNFLLLFLFICFKIKQQQQQQTSPFLPHWLNGCAASSSLAFNCLGASYNRFFPLSLVHSFICSDGVYTYNHALTSRIRRNYSVYFQVNFSLYAMSKCWHLIEGDMPSKATCRTIFFSFPLSSQSSNNNRSVRERYVSFRNTCRHNACVLDTVLLLN